MSCSPINSYKELISFSKISDNNVLTKKTLGYQNNDGKLLDATNDKVNKVIFCHDMMGGYLDDALATKNDNIHAYRFYHWHLIDIFIYFSHNFITIPPINWIKLCKLNGVQCYGTLIVEGNNNENFNSLFSKDNIELGAEKLTEIKNYYQFDGWLINIECRINIFERKEKVQNMVTFLSILKALGNEVIWYDSVTESGDLNWQNTLNTHNKLFYDAVGGNIFTNYTWNDNHIQQASITCNRNHIGLYIGVDCFGRGCPGGGKLNCKEALRLIEENYQTINRQCSKNKEDSVHTILPKFSVALFAPGWCYESVKESERDKKLVENVWLFYDLITQYLQPFSPLTNQNLFRSLPDFDLSVYQSFKTDFSLGQAIGAFSKGKLINNSDGEQKTNSLYHNYLGDQQYFPTGLQDTNDVKLKIKPVIKLGFSNYGCAQLELVHPDILNNKSEKTTNTSSKIELWRMNCFVRKNNDIAILFVVGFPRAIFDDMTVDKICLIVHCSLSISGMDTMKTVNLRFGDGCQIDGDYDIIWLEHNWSLLTELTKQYPDDKFDIIDQLSVRIVKFHVNDIKLLFDGPVYLGRFCLYSQ